MSAERADVRRCYECDKREAAFVIFKSTEYFLKMRERPDRQRIKIEWIEDTIKNPTHTEVQSDGRIRRWKKIEEEDKYLRVVLLEDEETVHNAFFDRNFKGGPQ